MPSQWLQRVLSPQMRGGEEKAVFVVGGQRRTASCCLSRYLVNFTRRIPRLPVGPKSGETSEERWGAAQAPTFLFLPIFWVSGSLSRERMAPTAELYPVFRCQSVSSSQNGGRRLWRSGVLGHHVPNASADYRGTSLIRNTPLLGTYSRTI